MMKRLGTSYGENRSGTLRNTMKESLDDLKKIFDETGGTRRFEIIEKYSSEKAKELGKEFSSEKDEYWRMVYNK